MYQRCFALLRWMLSLFASAVGAGLPSYSLLAEQPAAAKAPAVDFAQDVAPIFRRSCVECHGPAKQEAGLRLDGHERLSAEAVIEPGRPEASELWRRINLPRGHEEIMPSIGQPLSADKIEIIRRWIAEGAAWPAEIADRPHWAYVRPTRAELPAVSDRSWAQQPIDRFVLHRLEQEGLHPSPRAEPEKLVRRLFLDLIGLPPSLEEVQTFAADPSDQRLGQLVDDLLSRPQFGERWARPWLDAARYADSHGFQRDNLRDMWAYRDWVIQSLNADMPFDQFSIEQLAGDLLPEATESQKIATGFHRCSPTNIEAGSLPEETRIEQVIDRVNTTGAVWLGTTLECCQCHDHKYDPFTQREYYQLLAFFNNTQLEADRANPKQASSIEFLGPALALSDPERDRQRAKLDEQLQEAKLLQQARRDELAASLDEWVADMASEIGTAPQNHSLEIGTFVSQGSTDIFHKLEDGSLLLVGGDPPDTDVYEIRVATSLQDIRAFRLDALRHESLPGQGPGRGDAVRRNFVLNDFTVELLTPASQLAPERLKFASARASFSQKGWDVAGAVDDDPKSGWAIAPQFDRAHWGTFHLAQPLNIPEGSELVFRLRQSFGSARTIGCFRLSAVTGAEPTGDSISSDVLAAVMKTPEQRSKADRKLLVDFRIKQDAQMSQLSRQINQLQKQLTELAPDTTQVMVELPEPRMTALFQRGDYRKPGEPVSAATPAVLHSMPDGPRDRLALARWLTAPENPLVARVTVNRWWAELFGEGIVSTVEDFGIKGDPPTHPELLDWLALDLVEGGWSMKRWLKTVVLSATYQQSSHVNAEHEAIDPHNHWLARGPRLRMDAEMIRDNALAISGLLDAARFGSPIRPFQPEGIWSKVGGTAYTYETSPVGQRHRRGIYVVLKRGTPYPSFINFDATARQTCTLRRSRTNTPLQALTLLNDPVYVEAAQALAVRAQSELAGESFDAGLDALFQLCTARKPTASERSVLSELYRQQRQSSLEGTKPGATQQAERDAWVGVATVLLNLHETITKD